jgi:hypothetical protein
VVAVSQLDVEVENHGSVVLVRPLSDAARAWLAEHVSPDAQRFGGAVAVEPRYVANLVDGMIGDGLVVN